MFLQKYLWEIYATDKMNNKVLKIYKLLEIYE